MGERKQEVAWEQKKRFAKGRCKLKREILASKGGGGGEEEQLGEVRARRLMVGGGLYWAALPITTSPGSVSCLCLTAFV